MHDALFQPLKMGALEARNRIFMAPLTRGPASPRVTRESTPNVSPERPMRLLVVEDHAPTLQVLVRLLTRAGHRVTSAASVASARAAAEKETFDAVISDVGLPDGTGLELMRHLQSTYGLRGIALSGYGMEDDVHRSSEAGFAAHLVKPVDVRELRRALERLL